MLLIALLSLIFSGLTVSPELYSLVRAPQYWIPLNSHPITVGDDYHYFAILNRLSNLRLKNRKFGFAFEQPARANVTQTLPQLLNLVPFSIGQALLDKRFGLLLVRLFNRFAFFFSCALVSEQVAIRFFENNPKQFIVSASGLFLYLLFPGPFTLNTRRSLLRNLSNPQFIFEKNRTSDLSRAYVLETVLPIYLFSTYLLLRYSHIHNLFIGLAIFLSIFNLLAYPPLGLVYLFQAFSIAILSSFQVTDMLPIILFGVLFLFLLDRYIRGDSYGQETYTVKNLPRAGIKLTKWNLAEVALVIFAVMFFLVLNLQFGEFTGLIGILIIFDLTSHHNFSRIWFRGAAPVFQLYSLTFFLSSIYGFTKFGFFALSAFFFALLIYFYIRQSRVLYDIGYFSVIPEYRDIFKLLIQKSVGSQPVLLVSNDTEILKLASIYSCHHVYGLHHGLSQNNFEDQLVIMANTYIFLGLSFDQFQSDFTFPFDYFDYLNLRRTKFSYPVPYGISSFCKQMFATYSIFNEEISNRGYLLDRKWTSAFDLELKRIWDSASVNDILRIGDSNRLKIERVLRNDDLESSSFSIYRNPNAQ